MLQHGGRTSPVLVGSVKANLGHTFSAAGIASLVKVVLCLQHGQIPLQPNFHMLNPNIQKAHMISVPTTLIPWPAKASHLRTAIVSSFGLSGTDCQVSVTGAPAVVAENTPASSTHSEHIITISARSSSSLRELHQRHVDVLKGTTQLSVPDYCATSNLGRAHFDHRIAVVASTRKELVDALTETLIRLVPRTTPPCTCIQPTSSGPGGASCRG
mmetsp:Transcript_45696/g.93492  ORF Transcript_45696/g.93492 Transcript_45696/m.93492 type:complete len:214 (-) Transcript_45696:171-812(-)